MDINKFTTLEKDDNVYKIYQKYAEGKWDIITMSKRDLLKLNEAIQEVIFNEHLRDVQPTMQANTKS